MATQSNARIRLPSVAGQFYPADARQLDEQVSHLISQAQEPDTAMPKAVIAPHAGYIYSGPVAATAYKKVAALKGRIERVVLLSPAHRYGFYGIAWSDVDYFRTPLGDIEVDRQAIEQLHELDFVQSIEQAFDGEHALEVHLPFLQKALGNFKLVPFVVGQTAAEQVASLLELLWGDEKTLIVISSDLSHFHPYPEARQKDRQTAKAIENKAYESLNGHNACGIYPVSGLLLLARQKNLEVELVDLRNSGDTAGSHDSVVGYGAFLVH